MQILKERYEPGSDTGRVPLTHDGEEGGIVVSGRLEVTVDDERRILDPGDAYYFESRRPHRFRCVGGKAVRSDLGLHAADVLSSEGVRTIKKAPAEAGARSLEISLTVSSAPPPVPHSHRSHQSGS